MDSVTLGLGMPAICPTGDLVLTFIRLAGCWV